MEEILYYLLNLFLRMNALLISLSALLPLHTFVFTFLRQRLTLQPRLAPNWQHSSCLSLFRAEVTRVYHHSQLFLIYIFYKLFLGLLLNGINFICTTEQNYHYPSLKFSHHPILKHLIIYQSIIYPTSWPEPLAISIPIMPF